MADAAKFAHLHLHTHYSLLDGFNRIPTLVEQTKKLGMNAVAITDHGNLYGAIEFYEACKKGGINPIIGYEAYLAPNHRSEKTKTGGGSGEASTHLTLLAKNRTGFYNLIKLSSIAFLEGFYYKPRIDREVLEKHSEGLICLSGCLAGQFNQFILQDRISDAEKLAKYFAKTFKNNFYIEIQNNGIGLQDQCTPVAADIAEKIGVPLVATADAHYLEATDAIAHDIYFCINTKRLHDPRKKTYPEEKMPNPYYVRSPQDMYKLFPNYADAVARTQEIANGVDIQLEFGRNFPVFQSPRSLTADEYLRELVLQGIQERYGDNPVKAVFDRMEIELGVISHMGYAAYFLIVWDFVRYARDRGIRSTARGSGVGAIVAYTLYISHVCPLEYDLLFERFLDKSRKEPPDIDIDFDQERREEVIQYVKEKYGHKSVAQIGTFGTLGAKAALKDVGRVLSIPLERVNFMCKLVPMKGAISLELKDAMGVPEFRREYDTDPTARHWIDVAMKLEGMNRNVGTHAAGVVIASGDITDYVPVQRVMQKITTDDGEKAAGEVVVTTQWEMGIVEKVGMLKMDFLGLRNLTMLDNTVKLIKRTRGLDVVPEKLPLDDPATYKLLQRGDAKGVFQLESDGMRRLLQAMKPDNIRDLIAVLALYRPGPLESGMVENYINRKHGKETFTYEHPVLEEVLGETYGVLCIHEDTRVAMADGSEKPIREVQPGELVHSLNVHTRRVEAKECEGCGPTRREDGVCVTLENGFSVVLTTDHPLRTWDGWIEAGQLKPGESLVAIPARAPQECPTEADLAPWLGSDEAVAYLLGYLTGDGCLTGSGVTIATGTEPHHRKLCDWLAEHLPDLNRHEYHHTRSWYVTLSHPELLNDPTFGNRKTRFHHFLDTLGMKCKATEKRVPGAIFRCPAPVRGAYLAGLFDSDGCFAEGAQGVGVAFLTTASAELREDVRRLFQLDGVLCTLYPQRVQVWGIAQLREAIEPYLILKRLPEKCPSGSKIGWVPRAELLAAVLPGETGREFEQRTGIQRSGLRRSLAVVTTRTAAKAGIDVGDVRYLKVRSVEPVVDQQFYGISVADHHNLIANGIVVKNCYQEQIMRILNRLGGIELSKSYAVIKAISKKIPEKIEAGRADWMKGCAERGVSTEVAEDIFAKIVFFAGYGFNKCISSSTEIVDADTGEVTTVGELFRNRRRFIIHALGEDSRLVPRAVSDVMWNGRKRAYRLTTQLGLQISATDNHPFWTPDGWVNLGELRAGDEVGAAVPYLSRYVQQSATDLTPRPPLHEWRGGVQLASVSVFAASDSERGASTLVTARGEETDHDSPLDTPSPFMGRGTGGEVSDRVEGDVFWDRVVSIEYVGVEDTYDLTIEADHNFVADGLIVHNSHTAAYAQIGYQTAYLKTHFTAEFMAALLSSEIDEGNKRELMVDHIADARKLGVEVEAPNVNKGQPDFDVVNGKIVFGLTALKGLGRGAAEEIVKAREKGGTFRDLFDFCDRVDSRVVKTAQIEKLIKGGAMDCFGKNKRNAMLHALPRAVAAAEEKVVDKRRGQKSMFDMFEGGEDDTGGGNGLAFAEVLPDVAEWPDLEKLKFEKEVLDFYMSSHPLAQYDEQLRRFRSTDAVQCAKMNAGTEVRLAGMVVEVIPKLVSKGKNAGNRWAIVRIEDFSGSVKCILWSDQYQRFGDMVKADAILLFDGKVEWREGSGEPDVIVDKVMTMEQAKADLTRGMVLKMKYRTDDDGRQTFESLGKILKKAKGPCPVYLAVQDASGRAAQFKLSQDFFINPTQVAVEQLEMILGPGSVLFTSR